MTFLDNEAKSFLVWKFELSVGVRLTIDLESFRRTARAPAIESVLVESVSVILFINHLKICLELNFYFLCKQRRRLLVSRTWRLVFIICLICGVGLDIERVLLLSLDVLLHLIGINAQVLRMLVHGVIDLVLLVVLDEQLHSLVIGNLIIQKASGIFDELLEVYFLEV